MATIVVIGPPGAGKGTRIADAKEKVSSIETISTGALLRKSGIDTSSGALIDDDVVMSLLQNKINSIKSDIIILDGVPRTLNQAMMMEKYGIEVDHVIYLPIEEEEAVRRAMNRLICPNCQEGYTKDGFKPSRIEGICDKCGSKLTQRSDDTPETVKRRLKIYQTETKPILDWYKAQGITIITVNTETDNNVFIDALVE